MKREELLSGIAPGEDSKKRPGNRSPISSPITDRKRGRDDRSGGNVEEGFGKRFGEKFGKTPGKTSGKTSGKILNGIRQHSEITIPEFALLIGVTERSIERNIRRLQSDGRLRRVGPAKGGHWELVEKSEGNGKGST